MTRRCSTRRQARSAITWRRLGGYTDVEDTRAVPGIEWELRVDRAQAAKFGIDIRSVGDMVKMITNGLKFSTYRPGHV